VVVTQSISEQHQSPTATELGTNPKHGRTRRLLTRLGTVLVIVALYAGSQLGYALLDERDFPPPPTVDTTQTSVALIRLTGLQTDKATMNFVVVFYPAQTLVDEQSGAMKQDLTVQLRSPSDAVNFRYQTGDVAGEHLSENMAVSGHADDWPFDHYSTGQIMASARAKSGQTTQRVPLRVEVLDNLYGWDLAVRPVHSAQAGEAAHDVPVTIDATRKRSALFFDLGVCLLLLSLPAIGLFVAIETARNRRKFLPPLTTWFAAMVFSIVPLRSVLPGAPPPGAWIDSVLVLWVLVGLGVAMFIYIVAWWRQSD
jgi:hypothetical protein